MVASAPMRADGEAPGWRCRCYPLRCLDCHRSHRLSPVDPADELGRISGDDDPGTPTSGQDTAAVVLPKHQTGWQTATQDPRSGSGSQPERFLQRLISSRLDDPVRTGHILGVDVVLAKRVAMVLEAIQRHAGDAAGLRTKSIDKIAIAPPAANQLSALPGQCGERRHDHARPGHRVAFDQPQVNRQVVRRPARAERCRARLNHGQDVAATLQLAIPQIGTTHPSILPANAVGGRRAGWLSPPQTVLSDFRGCPISEAAVRQPATVEDKNAE